jgi:hypothetical protein
MAGWIAGHTQEMVPSTGSTTWLERAMGQITFYATFDHESSLRRLGSGDWVGTKIRPASRPTDAARAATDTTLKDRGETNG